MKILILINLLWAQLLFAQTNLESSFLSNAGRRLGSTTQEQLRESDKIIEMAKQIAYERYIEVKEVRLKSSQGVSYKALQIVSGNSSLQNKEAARVARSMNNLPLVFSPYDLGFGSNAFFDPNGSKLGVPYRFFTEGIKSSSYLHELEHASTYWKVLNNRSTIWAGVMRVLKGEQLSPSNNQYYQRFAALDEILATALSIDLDTKDLVQMKRVQTPNEFHRSRGDAANKLNEIYFSAKAGESLARQNADLAQRAIGILNSAKIELIQLKLGNSSKSIYATTFILDSYSRVMSNGRGSYAPNKDGASFTLYLSTRPTANDLKNRLSAIVVKSQAAEAHFKNVAKGIYVAIEYPDLARTNVDALSRISSLPYVSL